MGLFSFIKEAGAALIPGGSAIKAVSDLISGSETEEAENQTISKGQQLESIVKLMKFPVKDLSIVVEGDKATISGDAEDLTTKEKVVLMVGNTMGIASVEDNLTVAGADVMEVEEVEATRYHTVVKGDTLSLIAQAIYGDMMKYPIIFDANRPMLEHEDRIYPGQVLRIPALKE